MNSAASETGYPTRPLAHPTLVSTPVQMPTWTYLVSSPSSEPGAALYVVASKLSCNS